MRRKASLISFLACSALAWAFSGCGHNGPKVTVCLVRGAHISAEAAAAHLQDVYLSGDLTRPRPSPTPSPEPSASPLPQGCDCYDERTGKGFFLTLEQCDKYIALPPEDAQTLFNYCKMGH